ncbi:DUF2163 domain-containing protein [Oceanomicrobium pacificus]|uniref:DUF2163 domain-containing protein n=1 Tax=Oceanomicrobium pacificus TaxID=2692916 RepID=A0A6B0TZ79_9RHOB|nr:DUF2163 domain-containing protein [Oceanomicrobium pacificus]MXU66323.1 DUF2163 domain-containing protein [Oceanomicrobium pacificus]
MRALPEAMAAQLAAGVSYLCHAWVLTRKDGQRFGFTDHDGDLVVGDVVCRAASGLLPGAVEWSGGLSVDTAAVSGVLRHDSLSGEEIALGLFDEAAVEQWLVDWRDPELRFQLFSGHLGEIRQGPDRFDAELRGLSDALAAETGRRIGPACPLALGETACGVDLEDAAFRAFVTVVSVSAEVGLELEMAGSYPDGWFADGQLIWSGGGNAGSAARLRRDAQGGERRRVELRGSPVRPVAAGDTGTLIAGCDKRAETCREKFNNYMSYRGFPHVPGEDWLVTYPKPGGRHDGGRR